jgi:hypothetical protein
MPGHALRPTGLLPARPAQPRLRLSPHLRTAAPSQRSVDYQSGISFPVYQNDKIGDCAIAGPAHEMQLWSYVGRGKLFTATDRSVVEAYSAVSGYDPSTGENDDGCVLQDVLDYWRKTGIAGQRILLFASVDVSRDDEVDAAIEQFGSLLLGLRLPVTASQQLDEGKPWDFVSSSRDGAPGSWGGHCVSVGAFDRDRGVRSCVTWGAVQEMTTAFWRYYVDEAWVVVDELWVDLDHDGRGPVDLYSLGQEFSALTGEDNPLPPGGNPPAPDVDNELYVAAVEWLRHRWHLGTANGKLKRPLSAWVRARGASV